MITFKRTVTGLAALLTLGILSTTARAAETTFARTFDPGGAGGGPAAFTTDAAGNTVVVGTVYESTLYGPSQNIETIKYSRNGTLVWKHSYTRLDYVNLKTGTAVSTDAIGNVYAAGTYGKHYLVLKYSAAGVLLWSRIASGTEPYGSSGNEFINTAVIPVAIKPDNIGNVYIAGYSPAVAPHGVIYGGRWDITKLDAATGSSLWNRNVIGNAPVTSDAFNNRPTGLAIDNAGNVAVSGTVRDHSPSGDTYDLGSVEYSPSGAVLWKHTYRQSGLNTYTSRLVIDPSNNVYVSGAFSSPNNSRGGVTTVSYTSTGTQRWASPFLNGGGGAPTILVGLYIKPDGHIIAGAEGYFGGPHEGTFDYDPATGGVGDGESGGPEGTFRGFAVTSTGDYVFTADGSDKNDFNTSLYFNYGFYYYRGPVPGYGSPIGVQVDARDVIYVCGSTVLYLNADNSPHFGWALVKYLP